MPPKDVLAQVGARSFTQAELEGLLQAQPDFVRARYADPEHKREFVDALVRTELLAQEARRQGLDRKPEVQAVFDKLLVQQLVSETGKGAAPTESEVRAFYDAHLAEFSRPDRVRVALVEFGAPAGGATAARADVEKELAKLRKVKPADQRAAFATLVLARSTHEGTRAQEGDLGPRTREELAQEFSAQLAEAAFTLAAPGELAGPIEGPRGMLVVRLLGRQPGEVRSFESEKERLTSRLAAEKRGKSLEELVVALKAKTKVTIDDARVRQLDAKAPSGALLPP